MHYVFDFSLTKMAYEFTDEALIYHNKNAIRPLHKVISWSAMIGAGYYRATKNMTEEKVVIAQVMPPGVSHLMNKGLWLGKVTDHVLVVYTPQGKRRREMLYMNVRADDPETSQMVAELRHRLGDRWLSDDIPDMHRFRRELGLANWWIPIVVIIFLGVGIPAMLFLMIGWDVVQEKWGLYVTIAVFAITGILFVWRWLRRRSN